MEPTKVVGRRVAAFLIDTLVVFGFNGLVFALLAQKLTSVAQASAYNASSVHVKLELGDTTHIIYGGKGALYLLLTIAFGIGYWVVLQGTTGWTLGKRIMGIRLVKDDGTLPAGIGRTFARTFLFIADAFPYIIPYLVGFVVAKTSDRNQRIGDKVANTLVVRAGAVGQLDQPVTHAAPAPLAPEFQGGGAPNWPS